MALPAIMRRLFAGDGYGPLLKDDIVSRRISIQDWSNAFDYQTATAVRGSDGRPYWSVAASGPNSGGAANPVNDDGSHWVSLPSMADIAAMNYATQGWVAGQNYATQSWVGGQNYATQGWVQSLSAAPVYVDPNGSDSNDGMSAATAVQTFARALAIAITLPQKLTNIIAAGGSYTGNIEIGGLTCAIWLQGNATLAGRILVSSNGALTIYGDSYSLGLTTSGVTPLECFDSFFACNCTLNISYGGDCWGILANGSELLFSNNVSIAASSASKPESIIASEGTRIVFSKPLAISGSGTSLRVNIALSSSGIFNGITVANSLNTGGAIFANESSNILLRPGTYDLNAYGEEVIYSTDSSSIFIELTPSSLFSMKFNGVGGSFLRARLNSSIYIGMASGSTLSMTAISNIFKFFMAEQCSSIEVAGFGTVNMSGTVTEQTVFCTMGSSIYFGTGLTIPVNAVTGRKFHVNLCSCIFTNGAGVNRIPGSSDGTADAGSYGTFV